MSGTETVELLDTQSTFIYLANTEDIERERIELERWHHRKLAIHRIEYPTYSGARITQVTWRCVDGQKIEEEKEPQTEKEDHQTDT